MCPLRFVLVFFSLVIAGYLACKSFCFSVEDPCVSQAHNGTDRKVDDTEKEEKGFIKRGYETCLFGLSTLVDMATGRYLWKTMKSSQSKTS